MKNVLRLCSKLDVAAFAFNSHFSYNHAAKDQTYGWPQRRCLVGDFLGVGYGCRPSTGVVSCFMLVLSCFCLILLVYVLCVARSLDQWRLFVLTGHFNA